MTKSVPAPSRMLRVLPRLGSDDSGPYAGGDKQPLFAIWMLIPKFVVARDRGGRLMTDA
jgi:hypothetical protein